MDYPSVDTSKVVLMGKPTVLINWRNSIKVLKDYPSVLLLFVEKCQTCLLLMNEFSIDDMFVKLCIYGGNPASVLED